MSRFPMILGYVRYHCLLNCCISLTQKICTHFEYTVHNFQGEEEEKKASPDPEIVVDANLEGESELDKAENIEEEEAAGECW